MPDHLSEHSSSIHEDLPPTLFPLTHDLERDGAMWREALQLSTIRLEERLHTLAAPSETTEEFNHRPFVTKSIAHSSSTWRRYLSWGAALVVIGLLVVVISIASQVHSYPATPPMTHRTPSVGRTFVLTGTCPNLGVNCTKDAFTIQVIVSKRMSDGLKIANPQIVATLGGSFLYIQVIVPPSVSMDQLLAYLTPRGNVQFLDTGGAVQTVGTVLSDGQYPTLFTNADVDTGSVNAHLDQRNQPVVDFAMQAGLTRQRFAIYTEQHIGSYLTITLDHVVIESAVIQSQITNQGTIVGGPGWTLDQAQQLAVFLKDGALPESLSLAATPTATSSIASATPIPGVGTMSLLAGHQIFQTRDGGATWTAIPGPNIPANASVVAYATADAMHHWLAWNVFDQGRNQLTTARSVDGGKSWSVVPLTTTQDDTTVRSIQFIDSLNGWMVTSHSMPISALYRTRDGGITWEKDNDPFLGDATFVSTTTGWFVGGFRTTRAQFAVTHDGGRSWEEIKLDPQVRQNVTLAYTLPAMIDAQHGIVTVQDNQSLSLYHTGDGGNTWQLVKTITLADATEIFPLTATFGQQIWLYLAPSTLYISLDGGQTWQVRLVNDPNVAAASQIVFFTPTLGVALVPSNCTAPPCTPVMVLRTTDGGQTWVLVATLGVKSG